jgi:hypothetical protein
MGLSFFYVEGNGVFTALGMSLDFVNSSVLTPLSASFVFYPHFQKNLGHLGGSIVFIFCLNSADMAITVHRFYHGHK